MFNGIEFVRDVLRELDKVREKYKLDKKYFWDCKGDRNCNLWEAFDIPEERAKELIALAYNIIYLASSHSEALDIALSTAEKYKFPKNETIFLLTVITSKIVRDLYSGGVGIMIVEVK